IRPHASISELARHYNSPRRALQAAYERLGTRLGVSDAAPDVLAYIRTQGNDLLSRIGLTPENLPEISYQQPAPQNHSGINDEHLRLIGTALMHPHASISELADHYNWSRRHLQAAYASLGPMLGVWDEAPDVLTYVRAMGNSLLSMIGLTPDNLPQIRSLP
ncbi:hypothetical protein, partial [Streptomyces chartreusis]|uniref:hypothetical protein n=1 Tax=Streptomyces chartreusis TaxID=1969 RepID=UPI0033E2A0D5